MKHIDENREYWLREWRKQIIKYWSYGLPEFENELQKQCNTLSENAYTLYGFLDVVDKIKIKKELEKKNE